MSILVKDYDRFAKEAQAICKDRVYTDRLRRYAYGVDASCYSYLPKVVVKAENESEVRRLIRLCQQCGTPFTFRAAGSSLSGQCSSEDVLIVCNDGFKKMEVIDDGKALRCECGVIGSDANDLLKPYNRKIGPDIRAPKIAPGNVEILNISAALIYTFFCRKYANDPEMALHITENSDVPTIIDGDHSGNQYINNGTNTRPPPAPIIVPNIAVKKPTTIKNK